MDIQVKQIGNGYIIRSPRPSNEPNIAFPVGTPPELAAAVREMHGRTWDEWYCATLEQVKTKVPEIVANYFAAIKIMDAEKKMTP